MLGDIDEDLNAAGTSLVFAELKSPVRAKLARYQLIGTLDPVHFFPTLGAAVAAYRSEFGADWRPPAPTGVTVPEAPGSAPPAAP
jgi:hypothetical protein